MKTYLTLGGLVLCLDSERPLKPSGNLVPFYVKPQEADVTAYFHWNWLGVRHPHTLPTGHDLLQTYYQETDYCYCEFCGDGLDAVACSYYKPDFSEVTCAINEVTCRAAQDTDAQLLQMLPIRAIFLHFCILFLHASQITYQGRGIMFAAPSGTGKTTQAKLWRQYRGAEIVCNDRTLTRKIDGAWRTYGYPLDGSEPVRSSAVNTLGALVLLEQGTVNEVGRLPASKALPRLMPQMVMDCWSGEARTLAMELLLELLRDIPVYLLTCTPDERAVEVLEKKLTEDEVIPRGENFRTPVE